MLECILLAHFRKTKAGIKLHTLFDINTQIPVFIHITEANVHDVNAMDVIDYEPFAYYIFDRAYVDYDRLFRITKANAYFVVRAKSNVKFKRMYSQKIDKTTGIKYDQIGKIEGFYTSKDYPEKIRKVKYLQDQFELRARSNLSEIMERERSLLLEGNTQASFKLSPSYLASDEVRHIILKVISNQKYREIVRKNEAGAFSEEDLEAQAMYEEVINLDEVVTAFVQSGAEARWKGEPVSDLFSFLLQYHFHREVDEKERTTFFCQIVSLYESQLEIRNEFGLHNQYEYAKIYPL